MSRKEKSVPKSAPQQFRVVKIADRQRTRIRQARDAAKLTNLSMLQRAIDEQLPTLIDELASYGIASKLDDPQSTRLPIDDAIITALKAGSAATGLPAVVLMRMSLNRLADELLAERPRRGRRTSKKGGK